MRSRNLIDLADNPNFTSGVHNYCDRWCERCPLTARCVVYATEEADPDIDPASHDITNAAFWQKLASIFQETREMLTALAEENESISVRVCWRKRKSKTTGSEKRRGTTYWPGPPRKMLVWWINGLRTIFTKWKYSAM